MKYVVHNTVRARHTRSLRVLAAQHPRQRVHVGASQMRVVRGRPLYITEEQLRQYQGELRDKASQGILEVRTVSGQLVDLLTLQAAPLPVAPPLPNAPLDSIANDDPGPVLRLPPSGEMDEVLPGEPSLFANLGGNDEDDGEAEEKSEDSPDEVPVEGEEAVEEPAADAPEDTAKKRRPRKGKEK